MPTNLSDEQWERVKAVFTAALDRQPGERSAFVFETCGSDRVVRHEVERLLIEHERERTFLAHPAIGAGWPATAAAPAFHKELEESPSDSSSSPEEGRFPVGRLLAGRYRILWLLGRGGMGEVYRALDTKLNQPVALKFLAPGLGGNAQLLARLHNEVRLARQISHPNVCRVYDLGDLDGLPFISMEYIDGEDLKSLIRRIGRLPGDKAVEIARRLCAGLAAAHNKGVLHRDLKPANIMIDSEGQVSITDFGLAALAGTINGPELHNGTPAYMAPEQLDGRDVSVRSDLYSLGLVLYEMFSGKRAFHRDGDRSFPPKLSTVTKDIDPAVDRIVQQCLDPNPENRPSSALAVAEALPLYDPLAEALAAGETPSPEMVAAAGEAGSLSVRNAFLCLGLVFVGLFGAVRLSSWSNRLLLSLFRSPPGVLAQKARDLMERFGYTETPMDSAYGFIYAEEYQEYMESHRQLSEFRNQIARQRPPLIHFWYRQSPQYLETLNADAAVSPYDPPPILSGMAGVELDSRGRLISFRAVAPRTQDLRRASAPVDWSKLFAAADLAQSRFSAAEPSWNPPVIFDARAAWTGTYSEAPSIPLRIEAASWKGKPVFFQVIEPWTKTDPAELFQPAVARVAPLLSRRSSQDQALKVFLGLNISLIIACVMAWHNYRRGRRDATGSVRLAVFASVLALLEYLLEIHYVPVPIAGAGTLMRALGAALLAGALCWVLYTALEPYVRRRWPQALISWTRLLAGGLRDPVVAGQVLIGIVVGLGSQSVLAASTIAISQAGNLVRPAFLTALLGTAPLVNVWLLAISRSIALALAYLFFFFLYRAVFRRTWLAAAIFIAVVAVTVALRSPEPVVAGGFQLIQVSLLLWSLTRFGVLPAVVAAFVEELMANIPVTTDYSAWYATGTILAQITVLILAAWSFRLALGKKLQWPGFLER